MNLVEYARSTRGDKSVDAAPTVMGAVYRKVSRFHADYIGLSTAWRASCVYTRG